MGETSGREQGVWRAKVWGLAGDAPPGGTPALKPPGEGRPSGVGTGERQSGLRAWTVLSVSYKEKEPQSWRECQPSRVSFENGRN